MTLDDAIRGLAEELGRLLEDRFICFRKPIGLEELQVILRRNLRPWFDDYEKRSAEVFAGLYASGDSALAAKDKRIAELEGKAENRLKMVNLLLKLNAEFVTTINMLSQTDLPTPEGEEAAPCREKEETP